MRETTGWARIMRNKPTAVIGAGSWGTALALLLARRGKAVKMWGRSVSHVAELTKTRENRKYLPGHAFPDCLEVTGDLQSAVVDAGLVMMVVPSHGFRQVFRQVLPLLGSDALVVSAVKGIETESGMTMSDIIREEGRGKTLAPGVLSGPSFAREVADRQPTAITVAFDDAANAEMVQQLLSTDTFRVYTSRDIVGLEICGAMKNVIAIAAGICDGLHYGLNTRAALITRGLAEITRLGVSLGADPLTFAGLGGLGDLVLTCTGDLSRNRSVGLKLGSGLSLDQALAEMEMVAEGVKTTMSCHSLARELGVEMPILHQVHQVLYANKRCQDAVRELFQRDLKKETEPMIRNRERTRHMH